MSANPDRELADGLVNCLKTLLTEGELKGKRRRIKLGSGDLSLPSVEVVSNPEEGLEVQEGQHPLGSRHTRRSSR
jgi:hypothetical protein